MIGGGQSAESQSRPEASRGAHLTRSTGVSEDSAASNRVH
jgi:hypothetical protein